MTDTEVQKIVTKNNELNVSIIAVNRDIDEVVNKAIDLEDRSRRQNLLFFNIPEVEGELNTIVK